MVVDELYYGPGGKAPENVAAVPIDLSKAVQRALKRIYGKEVDPYRQIDPGLWKGVVDTIDLAAAEGIKGHPGISYDFKQQLQHNDEVFAAFKVHRLQSDMARQMVDAEGNIKSFEQWASDVQPIASHQCRQWLRTEYDTAIKRASLAADWQRFEDEKDVLPNLRWVPSTAANPDAFHQSMWDTVLPVDHPFWSSHHPGDRWGCQCALEATDDPVTTSPTVDYATSPGLENNPGRDAKLFNDTHPYFPDSCERCPFFYGQGRAPFRNKTKDCYNCEYLNRYIPGAATEKGYSPKLKKNILKVERSHRKDRNESAYIFDPKKGALVSTIGGKGAQVDIVGAGGLPKDSIVTHNHPRSIGKTGIEAIGNSFSMADLYQAIRYDVAEIRAVTPTYTFSMRRPESGWGVTRQDFKTAYELESKRLVREGNRYIDAAKTQKERDRRITMCRVTHAHTMAMRMASKYGWIYSKKNS